MNPTVRDLVQRGLKAAGYWGLVNLEGGCGCSADELAPCGALNEECIAGYYQHGCTCGQGCDFHVVLQRHAGAPTEPER